LIVAYDEAQLSRLATIKKNAELCSVNLSLISAADVKELEPELEVTGALLSHGTGIVNVRELCNSLLYEAEAHGALLALNTEVTCLQNVGRKVLVQSETMTDKDELEFDYVVNAAGLGAHKLINISVDDMLRPPKRFAKGNYFSISGSAPFSRLVYPIPEKDGLGIHYTLDTQGNSYLGPDVEWVDVPNYHVDQSFEIKFRQNVKKYWPGVEGRTLNAAYAGIRPKINIGDFIFHQDENIVSLLGIESPGITSSLSIANSIGELLISCSK
jgi:L-2-hydroxyglutarate oxidase LhgO